MRNLATSTLFACLMGSTTAWGQVQIDAPIILTGANSSDKQVTGVPASLVPGAVLSAGIEQDGTHRYLTPPAGNIWQLDLTTIAGAPTPGLAIIVAVPQLDPGGVSLLLNGNGPYQVDLGPGRQLTDADVATGSQLSLVFDGTSFQVLNGAVHHRRDCPSDMVAVNEQYCIEPQERDTLDFYDAAFACVSDNKRLCTWGEWYRACTLAATLGLTNMTGNWEWTNSSANEDLIARMVGNTTCTAAGTSLVTGSTPRKSRCCFSR